MTEEEREEILQELAKVCGKLSKNELGVVTAGCEVWAFVSVSSWKRRSAHWGRSCPPKRSSTRTSNRSWASILWTNSETTSAEAGVTCRPLWREFALEEESVGVYVGASQNKLPVLFSVNINDLWKTHNAHAEGPLVFPHQKETSSAVFLAEPHVFVVSAALRITGLMNIRENPSNCCTLPKTLPCLPHHQHWWVWGWRLKYICLVFNLHVQVFPAFTYSVNFRRHVSHKHWTFVFSLQWNSWSQHKNG